MRHMIVPGAVAVAIVGCVLAVRANVTTGRMHGDLGQERYKRMVAEEQLQKSEDATRRLEMELAKERNKIKGIQGILHIGQVDNKTLKAQVASMDVERASLYKERESLMSRIGQLQTAPASSDAQAQEANP